MFELDTDDPIDLFRRWLGEAEASEPNDANAMSVATADAAGRPSVRILLLKDVDERGFVFFTNMESQKGRELAVNPFAALCFHWKSRRRQVRVEGPITRVSDQEADDYFASRARGSRIGAWASQQSRPLASRAALMEAVERFDRQYDGGEVPRPPYWTGSRLAPLRIEFWQDGEFRLHDRFSFTRASDGSPWQVSRLFP